MKKTPECMMIKKHLYRMMLMKKVDEQVKLNESYEKWKENATMNVAAAASSGRAARIGCIECFENIKDKVVVITEMKKIKSSFGERDSETNFYICPHCLDMDWLEYKHSLC